MPKKKPQRKTDPRNVHRIVWFDKQDLRIFNQLPHQVWTADKTDAFAQALRYVFYHLKKHPSAYQPFVRESDGAWKKGTAYCMRMTKREFRALQQVKKAVDASSIADTVRIIVRMANEHFTE